MAGVPAKDGGGRGVRGDGGAGGRGEGDGGRRGGGRGAGGGGGEGEAVVRPVHDGGELFGERGEEEEGEGVAGRERTFRALAVESVLRV